jgi:Xaa-Pro aminopeptidase
MLDAPSQTRPKQPYRRFSLRERDRRWKLVRDLMERDGLDAIVAPPNNGNSTDWQADARYLSHCGGGADASIGCVFPMKGEVTVAATSAAERWGLHIQDWVTDIRECKRRYGKVMAERLLELGLERGRIGVSGLKGGTRTPEGTIINGTLQALTQVLPSATFVDVSELLQEAREVKSEEELAILQTSLDIIEKAVEAQTNAAQPGVPDYVVWAETMHALFSRGSELSVHFNWISAHNPGRTLTRPTGRKLEAGDLIVAEIESSVIGYRAQQIRPIAVNSCESIWHEMSKLHADLYPELLALLKPGITAGELISATVDLVAKLRPQSGPLAGARANLVMHGRGLGDDRPLLLANVDAKPDYEATARSLGLPFPENGVYICKPAIKTADRRYDFTWGDSVRVTPKGAVRLGKSAHGLIVSKPGPQPLWPTDVSVFDA